MKDLLVKWIPIVVNAIAVPLSIYFTIKEKRECLKWTVVIIAILYGIRFLIWHPVIVEYFIWFLLVCFLLAGFFMQGDKKTLPKDHGHLYEYRVAEKLKRCGFSNVKVTQGSGDYGVDVLARKNGKLYGIQCKHYSGNVGVHAVQEVSAGAKYYGCDYAVVATNSNFTPAAKHMASNIGVILWEHFD